MSNNLGAPTLTTTQTGKETTINDAVGQLDSAATEELNVTCSTGTEDYAISVANMQLYSRFVAVPGTAPAATDKIDFIFNTVKRWFSVRNELACPVHIYISTTHYGMVMPGETRWFYCDGTVINPLYEGRLRDPVRVAATSNVNTSTGLNSGDVIDGITLAAGDRVLLTGQSTAADNGVWIVEATPYESGEPSKSVGCRYPVLEGTYANKTFLCTATTPTYALAYYPFDIAAYVAGTPSASTNVLIMEVLRAFTLPASLTGSAATVGTAPSGGAVAITISKNGVSQGTINIADGATTATFTFSSAVTFNVGDSIEFLTPSDLFTCANLAISLKGQLA